MWKALRTTPRERDETNPRGVERRARSAAPHQSDLSGLEKKFLWTWQAIGGPALEREHRFHTERLWRFDFAHVASRVAVELEGGTWTGGRHVSGVGFEGDCEKYNEAVWHGWRVFRLTGGMIGVKWLERIKALMVEPVPPAEKVGKRESGRVGD